MPLPAEPALQPWALLADGYHTPPEDVGFLLPMAESEERHQI